MHPPGDVVIPSSSSLLDPSTAVLYNTFLTPSQMAANNSDSLIVPVGGGRQNLAQDRSSSVPRATFSQGSEEKIAGSRVTFTDNNVNIEGLENRGAYTFDMEDPNREKWDNKTQFYMGVISYAVGLGNVWRFPYLCQKNGGGAFLVPYIIMMLLSGLPLFLIELGIGQRMQTGPVGVWNAIHPYLGGIGIAEAVVSYLVALYYNVILTWCLYYFFKSFRTELPWGQCPIENGTMIHECAVSSSPTMYFWNREALSTSQSIGDINHFVPHLTVSLVASWSLIYLCVMRGIKSSGKVMYATATFPYVVTTIFLIRSIQLPGALDGLGYMIHPDMTMLFSPSVWLDAATQIFYSMGLGFGGLIAFGSYNKMRNDCKKDACILALVNISTSLYTAIVIFCVLGYMAYNGMHNCINDDMAVFAATFPNEFRSFEQVRATFTDEDWAQMITSNFAGKYSKMAAFSQQCNYEQFINNAAEGTGLAFVVFTEAIMKFPFPPIWSILFFSMLLMLGLGSMFGTLEGVITSLNDSQIITVSKPVLTFVLCASACSIGIIFVTDAGQFWVSLFDNFAGSYGLMCVAFMETIAVVYVYGYERFARDIEYMTGTPPSQYWLIMWRFVSPIIMFILFATSLVQSYSQLPTYFTYNPDSAKLSRSEYPPWALWIALMMVIAAIAPLPLVLFIRKFKIIAVEPNIPVASKRLNATQSTTYMLKSEQSFNRMCDSTVSVSEVDQQPERPRLPTIPQNSST